MSRSQWITLAVALSLFPLSLPAQDTDLILDLEGPGLVDSAAAISAALTANGKTPLVVPGDLDLTALDLVSPVQYERIWVVQGTWPNDGDISTLGNVKLHDFNVQGAPIYVEGADRWGFTPTLGPMADRDGVGSALDGDDSCVELDGQAVPGGPNFSGYQNIPYTQDSAGNDWTDQLTLATTQTDPGITSADIIFLNSDNSGSNDYIVAILAVNTIGGRAISSSVEFGGIGDVAQRIAIMSLYIAALDGITGPPDSDGDGVPDDQDLCPGSDDTIDTDADTIPDGCDSCPGIDNLAGPDCDGNGINDGCDVISGESCDVDGNGIPDQCETPTPTVTFAPLIVKNSGAHLGSGARDCAFLPSTSTLFVVDELGGPAWRYDVDLQPILPPVPSPAGANRITGISCNPNTNRLYWLDADALQIHVTLPNGTLVTSIPLSLPSFTEPAGLAWRAIPGGFELWMGDLEADIYFSIGSNGVPTGNSFSHPTWSCAEIAGGISARSNDSLSAIWGPWFPIPDGPIPVDKFDPTTGNAAGTPGDASSLGDPGVSGFAEAGAGSDGETSWYFCSSSGVLRETKPVDRTSGTMTRGDANSDFSVNIADAIRILGVLFQGAPPSGCDDASDPNDDGQVDIADAVQLLGFLFSQGAPPASPYPYCGFDVTPDSLTCASHPCP